MPETRKDDCQCISQSMIEVISTIVENEKESVDDDDLKPLLNKCWRWFQVKESINDNILHEQEVDDAFSRLCDGYRSSTCLQNHYYQLRLKD